MSTGDYQQRMKDIRNGSCFVCHKEVCSAWKHKNSGTDKKLKTVSWNNSQVEDSTFELEN